MTPDEAVAVAEAALSRKDMPSASKSYESAARALLHVDKKRAVHLLKLASNYAPVDDERQDRLAAEVQQILEAAGGSDHEIADVLLGRAAAAEQNGRVDKAHTHYIECIERLARNLMRTAESYLVERSELASLVDELQFANQKIEYCSGRLTRLEGGNGE